MERSFKFIGFTIATYVTDISKRKHNSLKRSRLTRNRTNLGELEVIKEQQ